MTDTPAGKPDSPGAWDRRSVLLGSLALAAASGCPKDVPAPEDAGSTKDPEPKTAKEAFLPVMVAIADRLLPADESGPGAKAAGVDAYFSRVFDDPRLTVTPLLKRGCAFLLKAARLETGKSFVELDGAAQDELLHRLGENQMRPDGFNGPTFVRLMLALTLEGFLCDPKHGGNKDGIGWKVVGFSNEGRAAGLLLKVVP